MPLQCRDTITDVPGIEVGHAQNDAAGTGCTVVLARSGAVAGVDVRGGAPGTRETDCLLPENLVTCVHAIYLGGGSAFGLEGACGVARWLEQQGLGLDVGVTHVPVVPGAVIFDLTVGDPAIRPDAAMGRLACERAGREPPAQGNVGAGTGAALGRAGGNACMMKGGLGCASRVVGDLVVGALVVVNCFGDVRDPATGRLLAGTLGPDRRSLAPSRRLLETRGPEWSTLTPNTTIGVIATNALLDKGQARRVAIMAHDGFARAIDPSHTSWDGDTVFALSTGKAAANPSAVGSLAAEVMARAIASAVVHAESRYGLPAHRDIFRVAGA